MEAFPGLWEIIWSFPTATDGWDAGVAWVHHQLDGRCAALRCLGPELQHGAVDGAADAADRHVPAHGAQAYVNVWPPAARGGNTAVNAKEAGRKLCYIQWIRNQNLPKT